MSRIVQIGSIGTTGPIQVIQIAQISEFEDQELRKMFEQIEAVQDSVNNQQRTIIFDYFQCYNREGFHQKKFEEFLEKWGSNHLDRIKEALNQGFTDSFDALKVILQTIDRSLEEEVKMTYKLYAKQLKAILNNQEEIIARLKRIEGNQQ